MTAMPLRSAKVWPAIDTALAIGLLAGSLTACPWDNARADQDRLTAGHGEFHSQRMVAAPIHSPSPMVLAQAGPPLSNGSGPVGGPEPVSPTPKRVLAPLEGGKQSPPESREPDWSAPSDPAPVPATPPPQTRGQPSSRGLKISSSPKHHDPLPVAPKGGQAKE
jgi:hypothetical protein